MATEVPLADSPLGNSEVSLSVSVLRKQAAEHRSVARLLRQAADQQAALLQVLQGAAKEEIENDMCTQLAQAEEQEETAAAKEGQALQLESGHASHEPPTPLHARTRQPVIPTPGRPAKYVTATLHRDSTRLFRLQLKEDRDGAVYVAGLPASDACDERSLLRCGDFLRSVGGRAVSTLSLAEVKQMVKEANDELELQVFRMGELPTEEPQPLQIAFEQLQKLGEKLGEAAGSQLKQLVDASKDSLEERGHSLQQSVKEVQGTVAGVLGGGLTQQLHQHASDIGSRASDFRDSVRDEMDSFRDEMASKLGGLFTSLAAPGPDSPAVPIVQGLAVSEAHEPDSRSASLVQGLAHEPDSRPASLVQGPAVSEAHESLLGEDPLRGGSAQAAGTVPDMANPLCTRGQPLFTQGLGELGTAAEH